ncbi:hypothetical protein [Nitrosopumilus sp.]|uniref:hypothetical protein n=1 Tax=Nitrosopumilus sp. TaxID=2024843 RepID=UPI0029307CF4|nr:hypothetical protein [Nitrosopumilus sp.]
MKLILTFSLLILVATMITGSIPGNVSAQEDLDILVKIAKRAQEQINNQISPDSSKKVMELFEEGTQYVLALERSVKNDDSGSAKENFLSAMKIFSEISRQLTISHIASQTDAESFTTTVKDPTNILQRLQVYVNHLKTINEKHKVLIDFTGLDLLFAKAHQQINEDKFSQALNTIEEIKETIVEINKEHRQEATKQESQRAKQYAMRYLEQLDRLIENAKKQGVAEEVTEKLETAKLSLSLAENPSEIIKEIRNVMSIKNEFKLTENDQIESKVLQFEKILSKLSQTESINPDDLANAQKILQNIKQFLNEGEFNSAAELVSDMDNQLKEIKNSLA